jgi:hypothetical protein
MYNIYYAPSFYAHIANGIVLFFAFIVLYNNYSKIKGLEPYKKIMLTLLFSIGIGIHGLSHLGLETKYNFNPLNNMFK